MAIIRIFGNVEHCLEARPGSTFSKMARHAGHQITVDGGTYDIGILWAPWNAFKVPPDDREQARQRRIINGTHLSHLKSSVMGHFEKSFGYALGVDPLYHRGSAVEKSDDYNGTHSGRIIECPIIQKQDGKVYQVVVDNAVADGLILDVRVPIVGQDIPFVWKKYRPIETRFSNINRSCELHRPIDLFDEKEIARIKKFAFRAGLEWGELDVIRDRTTRQIYIVDLNNTPMGPPNGSRENDGATSISLLAEAFYINFL